jgi:hypothetical protein
MAKTKRPNFEFVPDGIPDSRVLLVALAPVPE